MGNVRIISASAGSGKTYRLAYEYVKSVVGDPSLYRRILAVTFTNKATEEMRGRILERIHELATDKPSPYLGDLLRDLAPLDESKIRARAAEVQKLILHDYSRFSVLTIDRFFQRLIRSFIRELGVEVNFNLELETDSLLSQAADALIEHTASDETLRASLFAAARDRIDRDERWNVKEPLLALGKELFGEEYARTRAGFTDPSSLVEAIAAKATQVQAEFEGKARRALDAISGAGLTADDFKGRSKSFVPYLLKVASGEFQPLSSRAREAMESDEISAWAVKTSPDRVVVEGLIPILGPLLKDMDTLYNEGFRIVASARLLRENYRNFMLLADLQKRIEQICRDENIMPISETNRIIARLVEGNDTPFVFEKAGSYFSRFFIDEFQDTSSSQWENFVPLLKNAIASEEGDPVMLIGDIKQAIYRWRGGDWQILSRRVYEDMGAGRVGAETLDVNYRSMRRVTEFNNRAVGLVVEAGNESLDAMVAGALRDGAIDATEAADMTGMLAEAYRGHEQKPKDDTEEGYVTFTVYAVNEAGEYIPPVVEKIEELQSRGFSAGDIAVLVRSNSQGAQIARMLLARKHENPASPYVYDVVTQDALMVGAAEVSRFIIACLSLSGDAEDTIQCAVCNKWLGRAFDVPFDEDEIAFFARLALLSPEEAFEEIVMRFSLQDRPDDIAYIQAVHAQIIAFSSRSVADIPLFLKWWEEKGATASVTMQDGGRNADGENSGGAITVSTIHKAKGLQYKAVIVPYLSWVMGPDARGRQLVVWSSGRNTDTGAFPINYKKEMADSFFSERYYREQVLAHIDAANMFYVAVTRAEQELHLMTSSNPRMGANTIGNIIRTVLGVTEDFTEWGAPVCHAPVLRGGSLPDGASDPTTGPLRVYPTSPPGAKVKLRLPSSRYIEEDGATTLAPRDFGILMHRAFENATGRDDVLRATDRMLAEALVSPGEYEELQDVISRAFSDPLVAEWFTGPWDAVRNEGDILTPGDPSTKRPDRVMLRGDEAVVVDYKFGRKVSDVHASQLRGYMSLLSGMDYKKVEGYIWYVSLDKIVQL